MHHQCFTRKATRIRLGIETGHERAEISNIHRSSSGGKTGSGGVSSVMSLWWTVQVATSPGMMNDYFCLVELGTPPDLLHDHWHLGIDGNSLGLKGLFCT
jgi:hypothetical protein